MNVPMVNLRAQYNLLRSEIDLAVLGVLASGVYVNGPNVLAFEREAAEFLGVAHAIGCASGTDALSLALRAAGVGPGDEVITTPFTFIATAEAIVHAGARPVFVDIQPDTFNLDPELIEAAITPRTRAVLPVHLYGLAADLDAIGEICVARGLRLVEDAAQAFGGSHRDRGLGGIGDLGCFSFYPSKNLGAYGDGGMVVTQDHALARRVRLLREHGHVGGYRHEIIGFNSRLDEIQAAVLRVKLRYLPAANERRRQIAAAYTEGLAGLPLVTPVEVPFRRHVYHQYTLRTPRREAVRTALASAGVGSVCYYPVPVHLQPSMRQDAIPSLPVAEAAAAEVLSLPMHPELDLEDVARVCEVVKTAHCEP